MKNKSKLSVVFFLGFLISNAQDINVNNSESSHFTIMGQSFTTIDLAVSLKNFSNYTIPYTFISFDLITKNNFVIQTYSSFSYSSIESSFYGESFKTSGLITSFGTGLKYYFNEALKINPEKIHIYGGLSSGVSIISISTESSSSYASSTSESETEFGFIGQVGGRYFFNKRWGLKSELQFAKGGSNLLIGLSYKMIPKYK